jgi:hypothetical protein
MRPNEGLSRKSTIKVENHGPNRAWQTPFTVRHKHKRPVLSTTLAHKQFSSEVTLDAAQISSLMGLNLNVFAIVPQLCKN